MEKDLKAIICKAIDDRKDDLNHVSQEIWKNPELNFEERFAHRLLTTFLENEGFKVHKSYPIETSFVAKYGNNIEQRVRIGIICEYDALLVSDMHVDITLSQKLVSVLPSVRTYTN